MVRYSCLHGKITFCQTGNGTIQLFIYMVILFCQAKNGGVQMFVYIVQLLFAKRPRYLLTFTFYFSQIPFHLLPPPSPPPPLRTLFLPPLEMQISSYILESIILSMLLKVLTSEHVLSLKTHILYYNTKLCCF